MIGVLVTTIAIMFVAAAGVQTRNTALMNQYLHPLMNFVAESLTVVQPRVASPKETSQSLLKRRETIVPLAGESSLVIIPNDRAS